MVATSSKSTFIIAEAGVNHNGKLDFALQLVDAAADAGADAIKFQTFSADKLVRRGADKVAYQKNATGGGDQFDMLKALEMSPQMHECILERCRDRGIEFMSTAFDEESFDYLVSLGIRRVKVPSGEITNYPFLRYMARSGLPIILSTGMATLEEVWQAVNVVRDAFPDDKNDIALAVLHCTSNYPALPQDVNLSAMLTIASNIGVAVGYSDHTLGITVSIAAAAMGAEVIEKHFTLDKELEGPDHRASLDAEELKRMVEAIRIVEVARGNGVKAPAESELHVRELVRRSVTSKHPIAAGTVVKSSDLVLLRPGNGIQPGDIGSVVGRRAARNLTAGETLQWGDLL